MAYFKIVSTPRRKTFLLIIFKFIVNIRIRLNNTREKKPTRNTRRFGKSFLEIIRHHRVMTRNIYKHIIQKLKIIHKLKVNILNYKKYYHTFRTKKRTKDINNFLKIQSIRTLNTKHILRFLRTKRVEISINPYFHNQSNFNFNIDKQLYDHHHEHKPIQHNDFYS